MREETRAARQAQIEQAAYEVLEEKGYAATSMLAIAKRARASNETLYNWYGDKTGLFRALVVRNAEVVRQMLEAALAEDAPPLSTLEALGPGLLALLTSSRAVQLNRAAAADPTGELGALLSEQGRETVAPLIGAVLERARAGGFVDCETTEEAVGLYLDLLVGDLQIRRAIGRAPPPDEAAIAERARRALERFLLLTRPA
ncbi:MAG: TetR/AcrR family transcriptional regulator [Hoeflea sp.]|uniref:TetR/AcrR family transcriptional regulator n=1 Tax=Hoeflea sp. TaxID=1940281 RepID=UPI0032ED2F9B